MKEKLYDFITHGGIKVLRTVFPEYFAKEPLGATDRYIEYPFVLKNIPKPPCRILDVGCTGSMFPLLLKALDYDVMGVDIRKYPMKEFPFHKYDICGSQLPNSYFNIVTAISTIEHIGLTGRYGVKGGSDVRAMEEIHRILKPNGKLVMTVPYGEYRITKNHKIYDAVNLHCILHGFTYDYSTTQSPEAKYELALIKATKCESF